MTNVGMQRGKDTFKTGREDTKVIWYVKYVYLKQRVCSTQQKSNLIATAVISLMQIVKYKFRITFHVGLFRKLAIRKLEENVQFESIV